MTTLLQLLNDLAGRQSPDVHPQVIQIVRVVAAQMLAHRQQEREEFKALQRRLGHLAVDRKALAKLLQNAGLTAQQVEVAVNEVETGAFDAAPPIIDAEPEFTHPDADLNTLLNVTAVLLSGNANMDIGILWSDALDAVEKRLAPKQEVRDISPYILQYRLSMTVDKMLGRSFVSLFNGGEMSMVAAIGEERAAMLLDAVAHEFGTQIDEEMRAEWANLPIPEFKAALFDRVS